MFWPAISGIQLLSCGAQWKEKALNSISYTPEFSHLSSEFRERKKSLRLVLQMRYGNFYLAAERRGSSPSSGPHSPRTELLPSSADVELQGAGGKGERMDHDLIFLLSFSRFP